MRHFQAGQVPAPDIGRELARVAAAAAIPLAVLVGWQVYASARAEYEAAAESTRRYAELAAGDSHRFLDATREMLERLAARPQVRALDRARCDPLLAEATALVRGYNNIAIFDHDGNAVCAGVDPIALDGVHVRDRDWYREMRRAPRFLLSEPVIGRLRGRPSVVAALPVFGPAGELEGIATAGLDLLALQASAAAQAPPEGMILGIVDGLGRLLSRSVNAEAAIGREAQESTVIARLRAAREAVGVLPDADGSRHVWAQAAIPGTDWTAFAHIPASDVFGPAIRRSVGSLAVVAFAVAAALVSAYFAVRRLGLPIQALAAVVRRRVEGDETARPSFDGPEEIREVARELDRLIDGHSRAQRERELLIERQRMLLERMPIPFIVYDENFRVVYCNPAGRKLFGYSLEEVIGRHPFELWVPPHQREQVARLFERLRAGEQSVNEREVTAKSGERVALQWFNTPLAAENGEFAGAMVMALDMTERVRVAQALRELNEALEERVALRTAELATANRELEAFSYSVAHDLRAPLRAIDAFVRLAEDALPGPLSADAGRAFVRIRHNVARMARLIEDLLMLARIQRLEVHREAVDLTALARSLVEELRAADPGRQVEVTVAEGLVASADPALARVVLENLLANAWKFTARQCPARIEVGAADGAFYVRDNGAGFDPRFADKLFGPFQRLHTEEEFAGTGIGLATAHRILRRHGGEISAAGEVGAGATFRFTFQGGIVLPQAA